jgi:hypothetical protein
MSSKDPRAGGLHGPWPTAAEELEAEYGDDWEIWREVEPDGAHGDWIARRWPTAGQQDADLERIQGETIDGLREILGGKS